MNKVAILIIALAAISLPCSGFADEPPKFSAPEVNDYVKRQTAWMDEYIVAVKAGDDDKKQEINKKMTEDADKNMFTIYEKLTAAEKPIYDKWVKNETERMGKALQEK